MSAAKLALRNIAIIAHVDHGKTTLVDQLFRQSGTFRDNQRIEERAMDSNDLEKERGITILAKPTSVEWTPPGGEEHIRINIVDTPGHADFGGEVERILSMVDGVILLVDSSEGAMPQTKFVTGKALALGLKPIVVVNKVDRPDERIQEVLDEVFDLFVSLEASDEQLDFPVLYASGRNGYASEDMHARSGTLTPMFEKIVEHVPPPALDVDAPFTFLVTLLDRDNFLGRVLTGRVTSGSVKVNQAIHALDMDGKVIETGRASKLMAYRGLERVPVEEARAGDIISLAGLSVATVANTICDIAVTVPIQAQPIDPPTLSMRFAVNDSPMAGREGTKVTSRMIRDRLERESESNVAIKVTESADKDSFEVAGRGELQLGVLIETMRREGFELGISRPRVLYLTDENGKQTGEVATRTEVHEKGLWHRAAHVYIVNSKNEVLLQCRAAHNMFRPGRWYLSAGGHLNAGETSLETAAREIREELGLDIPQSEFKLAGSAKKEHILLYGTYINNEIDDIYVVHKDVDIAKLKKHGEIADIAWIPFQTFKIAEEGEDPAFVSYEGLPVLFSYLEKHAR